MQRTKEQDRVYQLNRYHTRRRFMFEHLGGCCVYCGGRKDLQIDHIENLPDKIPLGKLWGIALERLLEELTRCQLLCRECHDQKSIVERGQTPGLKHGTLNGYKRYACRCTACIEVTRRKGREYSRRYRRKKKDKVR